VPRSLPVATCQPLVAWVASAATSVGTSPQSWFEDRRSLWPSWR
jgi:hypothetical protein